jgi:inner membrane protein
METMSPIPAPPAPNLLERFNTWIQESIMIKLFSIGFLILILLIPSSWIESLIEERQYRANEVIQEVSDKWSVTQTLSGPVLVIPYTKTEVIDRGKDGIEKYDVTEKAFFLPEQLNIDGNVTPQNLHRGIFDVVVYQSTLKIKSEFAKPDFKNLNIPLDRVQWKDAYLVFGITDLRGISDNPVITLGQDTLSSEPSNDIGVSVRANTPANATAYSEYRSGVDYATVESDVVSTKGIMANLNWEKEEDFASVMNMKLDLKGSQRLDFVPGGKTTEVKLSGKWPNPSFDGKYVPATREITDDSFAATWKVLHFNRPFSQQWTDKNQSLSGWDFGVKLLVPVDQYQKSIRTSKYGILIILLTFISLLLVEITQKLRIHPFQYILIGAALTIYYTLLLSFSEHLGYNTAYLIASVATVILISAYATTFISSRRLIILVSMLLVLFYSFIFIIILQQELSLLLGSVGLFIIIGMLMYFSRKVKWYAK